MKGDAVTQNPFPIAPSPIRFLSSPRPLSTGVIEMTRDARHIVRSLSLSEAHERGLGSL